MAHLTLGLLGPLQITVVDGSTAKIESDKARALLAFLAIESHRPHRRETLVGLFWPDSTESLARASLRQTLYNLRQALGDTSSRTPHLYIHRDEIQFNAASDCAIDVAIFQSKLAASDAHSHPHIETCSVCAVLLREAADQYRGKFLDQFFLKNSAEFEDWALVHRESLHRRALQALEHLGNYHEQRGEFEQASSVAQRQLDLDPWREEAHRQMMRVLAHGEKRSEALAQYETCRRVLADQLGVEPSRETRELYEQIRAGKSAPAPGPGMPLARPASNLPAQLTPFIGRERELTDLGQLLADPNCRCITLVGPGGIGKTRLALQVASLHRREFSQGVIFVPLVTVDSAETVVPAIADALGFTFYGPNGPRVQLLNYLREKQMLLVLDNIEQLVDAAELFVEILQCTTEIKLLLTSRAPLNALGEWVFQVEGLGVPEDDGIRSIESSAAVALFLQRAQRTRVGFALSAEDRPHVARLCRLVDGTPLALELAATWVRVLSVAEIVQEIERNLDFLSATVQDLPERHRNIRVVFDHSWGMLTEQEQHVLRGLSAFHGRFQRQAAEQVVGASLATLSALVSKSLVRRTDTGHYDLHELVRQYASAQLGDDLAGVAERHSRYYLDWLSRSMAKLRDRRQKETVAELAAEVDNLRAAWDWAILHLDTARVRQVSPALWYLFELRSWFAEGETIFHNAAETLQSRAEEIKPEHDAWVAVNAMRAHSGYFAFRQGKGFASLAVLLPSVKHLESGNDHLAATYALWYLGILCWELGRFTEARESMQASLDQARRSGEQWYATASEEFIGIIAHDQGEYGLARHHLANALTTGRAMGDPMLISHVLGFLGVTLQALGEMAESEKLLRESLAIAQEIGYRSGIGNALDRLGLLAQRTSPEQARPLFAASVDVFRETGGLRDLSRLYSHQGYNSFALGDVTAAQDSFYEVLRLAREGGHLPFALDALAGLAAIWANNSNQERALELVNHVLQHPASTSEAKSRAGRLRAELESRLTPEQIQTAQAQAQSSSFDQVVSQILGQLSLFHNK